jgi:hypothetical protein
MAMNNSRHLIWIAYGATVGFGSSCIFGDLLTLPLDLYYLIYFGIIITFFSIYIRKTQLNLKEWFSKRLAWGILLGLIFGALMMKNVLSRAETDKFTGLYLVWLIFWRGLVYGAIDGLLLSVFPWVVTWRALRHGALPVFEKSYVCRGDGSSSWHLFGHGQLRPLCVRCSGDFIAAFHDSGRGANLQN